MAQHDMLSNMLSSFSKLSIPLVFLNAVQSTYQHLRLLYCVICLHVYCKALEGLSDSLTSDSMPGM